MTAETLSMDDIRTINNQKQSTLRIKAGQVLQKVEQLTIVRTIRGGLVSMIPVLMIGAIALVLKSFPIPGYQDALAAFAGGFFLDLFNFVYSATFGVLAVYMTFFISRAYMKTTADSEAVHAGAIVTSMISFFILTGAFLPEFGTANMGPKAMFLAILTGMGASALYLRLERFFRHRKQLFAQGIDHSFNRMMRTMIPTAIVVIIFALLNSIVVLAFQVNSFLELLARAFNALFSLGGAKAGFFQGFFFVLFSSVLWFFGIHGSDTLEGVMETYFTGGLNENIAAVAADQAPQVILTKQFFDCFVLMGGCGTTICLLITILIFCRNRARRGLSYAATLPMLFNINEMMVFGLPIIYNPIMLIPFITVPLVCYSISYLALATGMVPLITSSVEWTTPILLGGYTATGSIAGAILQFVNVVVGVLIYLPFVKLLDRRTEEEAIRAYTSFVDFFKQNEQELAGKRLIDMDDLNGELAKGLCAELKHDLNTATLYYQPQYNFEGQCTGVEALLRWNHPQYGMLYPPLVVKLSEEGDFMPDLEEMIFRKALQDREDVIKQFGDVKLSINVTGTTVTTPRFMQFCVKQNELTPFKGKNICVEITEQAKLTFNPETLEALQKLREMGLMLAIDDFSMGQTSLNYLKENSFDIIKLDGSLVKGLFSHQNCREIITAITQLASTLNLIVIAEYVETAEERDLLHEIGCDCYQGYLFSPAVPLNRNDK